MAILNLLEESLDSVQRMVFYALLLLLLCRFQVMLRFTGRDATWHATWRALILLWKTLGLPGAVVALAQPLVPLLGELMIKTIEKNKKHKGQSFRPSDQDTRVPLRRKNGQKNEMMMVVVVVVDSPESQAWCPECSSID